MNTTFVVLATVLVIAFLLFVDKKEEDRRPDRALS